MIDTIYPGTFSNLHKLRHLNLSVNRLKKLNAQTFLGLLSLETLLLSDKDLTTLDSDMFSGIQHVPKFLDVSSNPLRCDSDLYWLQEEYKAGNITVPSRFAVRALLEVMYNNQGAFLI